MLTCQQCQTEIETSARREALRPQTVEHLAACAACHAFRSEQQSLRGLLGELEPVAAPADFEFRLRARMAARQSASAGQLGWARFGPRFAGLALASCLVLAAAATLQWRTSQTEPAAPSSVAQSATQVAPRAEAQPVKTEVATASAPGPRANDEMVAVETVSTVQSPRRHVQKVERPLPARLAARRAAGGAVEVNDIGVEGAPLITGTHTASASAAQLGIPVPASAKALQFVVKDVQGASRMISVEPVAFGSRDLLGGRGPAAARVVNATYKQGNQGVW